MITALAVGVLSGASLGGCRSPKPNAVVTTRAIPAVNPLTGTGTAPAGPVIAVKVDDTAAGRPWLGLEKADVIYIEEAEGGLSLMVAVYASAKPKIRAVRSVRTSDPEMLGAYGKIILVATEGGGSALPTLDGSGLYSSINDRGQVGFFRDPSRPAPYNVVSGLAKVSAAIKGGGVRNVGFTWAANDPRLGSAKAALSVSTLVGSTSVDFVWDPKLASYVRTVGGAPIVTASGAPLAKPNVLVQYCQISQARHRHRRQREPVDVHQDCGKCSRRDLPRRQADRGHLVATELRAPTTLADAAGKPLLMAPGGTFVALVRLGVPS